MEIDERDIDSLISILGEFIADQTQYLESGIDEPEEIERVREKTADAERILWQLQDGKKPHLDTIGGEYQL